MSDYSSSPHIYQRIPIEVWQLIIDYALFDPILFDITSPYGNIRHFHWYILKIRRTAFAQARRRLAAVSSSWLDLVHHSHTTHIRVGNNQFGEEPVEGSREFESQVPPQHVWLCNYDELRDSSSNALVDVPPDMSACISISLYHIRYKTTESMMMLLRKLSPFRTIQSLHIRTRTPGISELHIYAELFPQLVSLQIGGEGIHAPDWDPEQLPMARLRYLKCLDYQIHGYPIPVSRWDLPALRHLSVREIPLEPPHQYQRFRPTLFLSLLDRFGPQIETFAIDSHQPFDSKLWKRLPNLRILAVALQQGRQRLEPPSFLDEDTALRKLEIIYPIIYPHWGDHEPFVKWLIRRSKAIRGVQMNQEKNHSEGKHAGLTLVSSASWFSTDKAQLSSSQSSNLAAFVERDGLGFTDIDGVSAQKWWSSEDRGGRTWQEEKRSLIKNILERSLG